MYKHLKEKDIPYEYRDHAWFTCFAPAVNPEIVVTVLVEHGLHGGSASAPIAAKILNRYFEDKTSRQQGKTDGEQPGAQLPAGRVVLDGQMIEEADAPQDDEDADNGEAGAPPAPQPDESVNGPL